MESRRHLFIMPILKLNKHQPAFSEEDIIINQKDYPELNLGDVVQIKSSEGSTTNRLLLQVRKWPESFAHPGSISIKDSIANQFKLRPYFDVIVNIVDKKSVIVDSIEMCFSNAYLARSYMWGLRNHLNNKCVYLKQKIEYSNIRSQIWEIWSQGEKMESGYVDDDTKIVFRSASSLVYLFIQMSSEMWDYDINGDLYFEKAVNGFLSDLFAKWRLYECSHDITIVLFSRTFYEAESIEEFPKEMRECLQQDNKNRFYEDCYRVAFQNDRFDLHDWNVKLTTLRSLFNQYQMEVIDRHQEIYGTKIPRAYNSSASQGNFLEVLNMSLNVFEKHYFDRSFDRTGQLSVVVSPGVGVFEVDFEMTNLTKQRIIDNGIGSDLVCLGEQPLHTVPLLRFNAKTTNQSDQITTCDVYNMPHWINLSFYSTTNQVHYSNFVPRIKLPTIHSTSIDCCPNDKKRLQANKDKSCKNFNENNCNDIQSGDHLHMRDDIGGRHHERILSSHTTIPDLVDYDEYDAQVFKTNSLLNYQCQQPTSRQRSSVMTPLDSNRTASNYFTGSTVNQGGPYSQLSEKLNRRRASDVQSIEEYHRGHDQWSHDDHQTLHSSTGNNRKVSNSKTSSDNVNVTQSRLSSVSSPFTQMSLVDNPLPELHMKPESADDLSIHGYSVQSSRMNRAQTRPKALINPFDPSHMTIKLTPNRRRWTHVFPQGPTGIFMQQHHYQAVPHDNAAAISGTPSNALALSPTTTSDQEDCTLLQLKDHPWLNPANDSKQVVGGNLIGPSHNKMRSGSIRNSTNMIVTSSSTAASRSRAGIKDRGASGTAGGQDHTGKMMKANNVANGSTTTSGNSSTGQAGGVGNMSARGTGGGNGSVQTTPVHDKSTLVSNDTIRFAWCASGEQEWTPAITTGVDWKSLTMPACLPLTTDFFPSKTSLQNDYVMSAYTLLPECIHSKYCLIEVYRELVCQRLQKGFQIILLPRQKSSELQQRGISYFNNGNQLVKNAYEPSERTDYTMSIGRIFHRLTLDGSSITVTQYRPRHPYPTNKINYCYRFRAPFHENYGVSWVDFTSEKLENYNWNYLDNYICTRGESEFYELKSSLKFWRLRILILPSRPQLRKSRYEGHDGWYDCHDDYSEEERNSLVHSFIKFVEIINRTRRTTINRNSTPTSTQDDETSLKDWFEVEVLQSHNSQQQQSSMESSRDSAITATSEQPNSGNGPSETVATIVATTTTITTTATATLTSTETPTVPVATTAEIPSDSTIAITTTSDQATETKLAPVPIKATTSKTKSKTTMASLPKAMATSSQLTTAANQITIDASCNFETREFKFKSINIDIDSSLRDDKRAEWVHVKYHSFYDPEQAFELVIKWMVASGAGIAEMVQGWSRKAGNSNVHIVPIPWEPFALPFSGKADPLRCPIFIGLGIDKIPDRPYMNDESVAYLQERILARFGFIPFHDSTATDIQRQFVHISGFVFVMLPNIDNIKCPHIMSPTRKRTFMLKLELSEPICSPHEEYITRHFSGVKQTEDRTKADSKIGYLWSWNYMLTKRWRSASTQDEGFAVALMQNFREFCQNREDRLVNFWNEQMGQTLLR